MGRHSTTRAPKRSYKWCGDSESKLVEDFGNTGKSDIIVLCPSVGLNDYSDCVLERTIVNFSIRRQNATELNAMAGVVAVQPVEQTDTSRPSQVLDALSSTAKEFGARNILHWAMLPVPPVVLEADNTPVTSSELIAVEWDIPVKRRIDRQREIITLTLNTSVNVVVNVQVMWRLLLSYGKR